VTGDTIIAMVGTRSRIPAILADIEVVLGALDLETIVVTGDAPGVDLHVRRTCKHLGLRYIECHARWNIGPQAGPERNTLIARLAQRVIAWPATPRDGPNADRRGSAGTWNCVEQFESRKKPVVVRDAAWRVK
jgi:hypothetical protein